MSLKSCKTHDYRSCYDGFSVEEFQYNNFVDKGLVMGSFESQEPKTEFAPNLGDQK